MYVCQSCNTPSKPDVSSYRVVTATRDRVYPFRSEANKDGSDDRGGRGKEIVKEITVCPECFDPSLVVKETMNRFIDNARFTSGVAQR